MNIPRRVALVGPAPPWRGGIVQYTTLLDRALRQLGHDVILISFSQLYPAWLYPGRSPLSEERNALSPPEPHFWLHGTSPFSWLATLLRLRRWQPDVLILQWWTPALAPLLWTLGQAARRWLQIPVFFICHNVLPHESTWLAPLVTRWVLQEHQGYLVQRSTEKETLLDLLRHSVDPNRITVQEHPPYRLPHNSDITQNEARRQLDLPDQAKIILFAGLVRPYKGLEDLVACLPQVLLLHPDALLVVAGEFWMPVDKIQDQIASYGLTAHVHLRNGFVPEKDWVLYLQAASLLCAPYRHNTGSGLVAAAHSFPLAIVRTGEQDTARPKEGIFTAEPGNVSDLATQIAKALEIEPGWQRTGDLDLAWQQLAQSLLERKVSALNL